MFGFKSSFSLENLGNERLEAYHVPVTLPEAVSFACSRVLEKALERTNCPAPFTGEETEPITRSQL
jgi:hypothetical protein